MTEENVVFEGEYELDPYVIIGKLFKNAPKNIQTKIGESATIRSHSVIYAGNIIGKKFQTGHGVLIREYNKIGDDVSIGSHTVIEHHIKIANRVRIHSQAFIPEETEIEEGAWIGPNVVITNARYPLSKNVKNELVGAKIRKGAIIGANSTLLPGVEIGENAIVGAGSVVTKNVPDNAVVVGNPARVINSRNNIKVY